MKRKIRTILPAVVCGAAVLLSSGCTSIEEADVTSPASTGKSVRKAATKAGTTSQRNALRSAKQYLDTSGFSRKGLIRQLSSSAADGYSKKDATWAVDHLGADWKKQAVRSAETYLDVSGFSRTALIKQLTSPYADGYTQAEATYAANKLGL